MSRLRKEVTENTEKSEFNFENQTKRARLIVTTTVRLLNGKVIFSASKTTR